jgi:putative spermidine/putrescine transport system substrate-binding protein
MAFAASAQVMTVMSWGGAYGAAQTAAQTEAQTEAHVKPFTAAPGMAAIMTDSDNPANPIKAMVEAGNVTLDVAWVEYADAIRLCDEGVLEPIDVNALPAGNDGVPATEDFFEGAITECGVSTDIWSNVYGYDTTKFAADAAPTTAVDFIFYAKGFR